MTDAKTLAEYNAFAEAVSRKMMVFARERFSIPALDFDIRFNRKPTGNSRAVRVGDRYFISYAFMKLIGKPLEGFREYARFAHHPVIGSVKSDDWKVYVTVVAAHEVSHIIQFWLANNPNPLRQPTMRNIKGEAYFNELGYYEGGHGVFFQSIYRIMRMEFVNHLVARQDIGVKLAVKSEEEEMTNEPAIQILDKACVLHGMKVNINGHILTVLGRNANLRRKLYGYRAQDDKSGTIYSIQLGDIVARALDQATMKKLLADDPILRAEYSIFQQAQAKVRQAVTTRKRRAVNKVRKAFSL